MGLVQWGVRQSAELENTMTAVERVVEYENIEPEQVPNGKHTGICTVRRRCLS